MLAIGGADGRVQIVDTTSGAVLATPTLTRPAAADGTDGGTPAEITALAVSADGAYVAAAPRGPTVSVWTREGAPVRTLEAHTPRPGRDGGLTTVTSLAFADGASLVSTTNDFYNASEGDLRRWDVRTGAREDLGAAGALAGLSVSPAGRFAVGRGASVEVRDLRTNAVLHTLDGHAGRVRATTFAGPDVLASVDDEAATVRLWNVVTGTPIATLAAGGERCSDAWLSVTGDAAVAAGSFLCAGGDVRLFWLGDDGR